MSKFKLTEAQKGYVYMILGVLVLLYAFNFFKTWLNTLVIIGGILLFAYGFIKIDGVEKVRNLLGRK